MKSVEAALNVPNCVDHHTARSDLQVGTQRIPLAARGSPTFSALVATAFSPLSGAIDEVIRSGRGDVAFDRDAYFQLFSLWASVTLAAMGAFIAMWAYSRR